MPDDVSVAAVEEALRLAATSMHEQLTALDEAVAYHEGRARELRETRKRVARVEAIVNAPPDGRVNNGRPKHTASTRAKISQATARRHAAERAAKKQRVHDAVLALGPGVDIGAVDMLDDLNRDADPNDPAHRVGRGLVVELCRELRDDGVLRLDRAANGGKSIYRLVTARD